MILNDYRLEPLVFLVLRSEDSLPALPLAKMEFSSKRSSILTLTAVTAVGIATSCPVAALLIRLVLPLQP